MSGQKVPALGRPYRRRTRRLNLLAGLPLLAISVSPVAIPAAAGELAVNGYPYILVDPGTFGGPQSFLNQPGIPLTSRGELLGSADTTIADPFYPNFNPFFNDPEPTVQHAFVWRNGGLTDLGSLPGANPSAVFELNHHGIGAGASGNGAIDPLTGSPADNAVIFKDGQVLNLGTLPGGFESMALSINDQGQVAGFASNGIDDPFSFFGPIFGWVTQSRSFIWQNGVMVDLGTLGGPDAAVTNMNEQGQISGQSYTNSTPNSTTGIPTLDAFVWQDGRMQDLGSLGGTLSFANWMNQRGQVAGQATLVGDEIAHAFVWDGKHLLDLGTLGGDGSGANWVNEAGDVVGSADLPGSQTHDGFLWSKGRMQDLPPLGGAPCSNAFAVNDLDEVIGNATDCHGNALAAVLWKDGIPYDLNALVAQGPLRLTEPNYIDNQGDIVGRGVLADGSTRVFLLTPNQGSPLSAIASVGGRSARPLSATPGTGSDCDLLATRQRLLTAAPSSNASVVSALRRLSCK